MRFEVSGVRCQVGGRRRAVLLMSTRGRGEGAGCNSLMPCPLQRLSVRAKLTLMITQCARTKVCERPCLGSCTRRALTPRATPTRDKNNGRLRTTQKLLRRRDKKRRINMCLKSARFSERSQIQRRRMLRQKQERSEWTGLPGWFQTCRTRALTTM